MLYNFFYYRAYLVNNAAVYKQLGAFVNANCLINVLQGCIGVAHLQAYH